MKCVEGSYTASVAIKRYVYLIDVSELVVTIIIVMSVFIHKCISIVGSVITSVATMKHMNALSLATLVRHLTVPSVGSPIKYSSVLSVHTFTTVRIAVRMSFLNMGVLQMCPPPGSKKENAIVLIDTETIGTLYTIY
jgi:hypothetical protein